MAADDAHGRRRSLQPNVESLEDLRAYAQLVFDATAITVARARELRAEAVRIRLARHANEGSE